MNHKEKVVFAEIAVAAQAFLLAAPKEIQEMEEYVGLLCKMTTMLGMRSLGQPKAYLAKLRREGE